MITIEQTPLNATCLQCKRKDLPLAGVDGSDIGFYLCRDCVLLALMAFEEVAPSEDEISKTTDSGVVLYRGIIKTERVI